MIITFPYFCFLSFFRAVNVRDFYVQFDKNTHHITKVPLETLEGVLEAFQKRLALDEKPEVEFYDEDIKSYIVLDDVSLITPEVTKFRVKERLPAWWAVDDITPQWTEYKDSSSHYHHITVKDDTNLYHPSLYAKLEAIAEVLELDLRKVRRAIMIQNPKAMRALELHRDHLRTQHLLTPFLFKQSDWNIAPDRNMREHFLNVFEPYTLKGPWQSTRTVKNYFFSVLFIYFFLLFCISHILFSKSSR